MNQPSADDRLKNEGEGSRTADRRYREGVRRHVESGASQPAAEEAEDAEDALERAEADQLRDAEKTGKAGRNTQ